jgi:hypothetical protein
MHTLTFKRPGTGERVKLFHVETGTAISLVANGVAKFADRQTQRQVQSMIQSISGKRRAGVGLCSRVAKESFVEKPLAAGVAERPT